MPRGNRRVNQVSKGSDKKHHWGMETPIQHGEEKESVVLKRTVSNSPLKAGCLLPLRR
jgi:hypothetical protein